MNWFQANRALGRFLIGFGIGTLLALFFLVSAKGSYRKARTRFDEAAGERNRLERRDPFPNEANYGKLKVHTDNYGVALKKFEEELMNHTLPAATLAPNEFQTRLRQAMVASAEKARANRVRLPDNFALGFNEFTAALPNTEVASSLGQELAQVELLMNILIDARVDGVTALARKTSPPAPATAGRQPVPSSATGSKVIERNIVDLAFFASPSAARKVLNQIASANQQLYVIRALHVRSEKGKGPPREQTAAGRGTAADTAAATASKPGGAAALNFIVGNEHIETSARIEMLRLTF